MFIRKAFYWWLFPSAVVLPAWLLIGWAAFSQGSGWSFLGLLVLCPILFIATLVVSGIVMARRSVRERRAVSWWDVLLFGLWDLTIIGFGFFLPGATGWFAVVGILLFIALFWVALWELLRETRTRVQATFAAYERAARPQVPSEQAAPVDHGEYIVIEERLDRD
ncbi:hypothetical protein A0130_01055 [Leifsonia xyli]|uniref:hypothetical protein n=1 Tax=Leifsonia xyli TaxID=1575 RepID=UPI0007CDDB74|nr:hypothetical protein A0130_01055 [Leifsonia xyli]